MAVDNQFLGQLDPNLNTQILNAQQQVQMARALRGESLAPIQAPPGQNGVISPLSVLAKALMGYAGNKGMEEGNAALGNAESQIGQNRLKMMASFLRPGGGAQQTNGADIQLSSTPQASVPGASAQPTQAQAQGIGVPDVSSDPTWQRYAMGEQLDMLPQGTADAYAKARYTAATPTDQIKNDTWSGVTPQQRATVATGLNMKPNETRAQIGPDGKPITTLVAADPASNTQYAVGQDGTITANPVTGVAPAKASLAGDVEKAKSDNQIRDVTLPDGRVVPMRAGDAAAAGAAQAGVGSAPTYTGHQLSTEDLGKLKVLADGGNNDAKMLLAAHERAYPQLGADPTIQSARTGQQDSLKTKWDKLTADNATAQTANSYLQNIVEQAAKAAVGPQSDKIQFLNGLLSAAGISDRATDATTANNLIDKYHAQLTARLGGRSDAADAILAAGNPNSHMTGQAIRDAASNLQGANEMIKAKAALLAPHANALDPVGYSQKEIAFDQNADPRLWQYKAISDPAQRAAFLKNVLKQDPHFIDKAEALHKLGAY